MRNNNEFMQAHTQIKAVQPRMAYCRVNPVNTMRTCANESPDRIENKLYRPVLIFCFYRQRGFCADFAVVC